MHTAWFVSTFFLSFFCSISLYFLIKTIKNKNLIFFFTGQCIVFFWIIMHPRKHCKALTQVLALIANASLVPFYRHQLCHSPVLEISILPQEHSLKNIVTKVTGNTIELRRKAKLCTISLDTLLTCSWLLL